MLKTRGIRGWAAACIGVSALTAACAPAAPPRTPGSDGSSVSPLGPSYVLLPLPSEDESLLGRMLARPVEAGHSLEEVSSANPCADKLAPRAEAAGANTFEDAQDLSANAKASAVLGVFGFSADAKRATHLKYKVTTEKSVTRRDTTEYTACCAQKGCGYGYVSALVHGEGEYASAEEGRAEGSVSAPIGKATGDVELKVLHKRNVKGWIAALVTITDESKKHEFGPLGEVNRAGINDASLPEQVKAIYELDRIHVEGAGERFLFRDGRGATLGENEFVRRYQAATGAADLDEYKHRRNTARLIAPGILFAGSAAGLSGFAFQNPGPFAAGFVAVPGVVAFGLWFFVDLGRGYDGSPSSHDLDDRAARLYAEKYNRAMLRRAVKDVQGSRGDLGAIDLDAIEPAPRPAPLPAPRVGLAPNGNGFVLTF